MKRFAFVSAVVVLSVLAALGLEPAKAELAGEAMLGIGGLWPQGSYASYSDPGPHFLGRLELELPQFPALMGWIGVHYTPFSSETLSAEVTVLDVTFPVDQTTTQDASGFHLGLQLGSFSRQAFFRPRVGVGAGVYFFNTTVDLKEASPYSSSEPFASNTIDSHTCFGWRAIVGADFYFVPNWGISADLLLDRVYGLRRVEGDDERKTASTFLGFAVGVAFPLGQDATATE